MQEEMSMSTILAGRFQLQSEAERARRELIGAGFPEDHVTAFYLSQPGQHDLTPIGGDEMISPGAKESPEGVLQGELAGGAVGAAIGAATIPVTGPVGPIVGGLVGAHVGSLYSFSKMKDHDEPEKGTDNASHIEPRAAGMMVAVALDQPDQEEAALRVLRDLGSHHIERAEGTIVDGDWTDFDPNVLPHPVH
jgi:hypothetical protein